MRLTDEARVMVDATVIDEQETHPESMLEAALSWAQAGWYVFPLRPGTKVPLLSGAHQRGVRCHGECGKDGHGAWDGTVDEERIRRWWGTNPNAGIGGSTRGRVVFDLDIQHGANPDLPFPKTRIHMSGRGNGNRHIVYQAEEGSLAASIKSGTDVLGKGLDIRAGGGSYVVLPPTPHEETGQPYTIYDEGIPEAVLGDEDISRVYQAAGVPEPRRKAQKTPARGNLRLASSNGRATTPTGLADLLDNPPAEGSRNDWLTRISGHYAKMIRDDPTSYFAMVHAANNLLPTPLSRAEVDKISDSILRSEQGNHPEREADENTGYLTGDGTRLWCRGSIPSEGGSKTTLLPFGDFDIRALGVSVSQDDQRLLWVAINWRNKEITTTVQADLFGDDRATRKWLAGFGASVTKPAGANPDVPLGTRLLRYLNSQDPRPVRVVQELGYDFDAQAFVTPDGLITATSTTPKSEATTVVDPVLTKRGLTTYTYGFEQDSTVARDVLREVLTFQEPTVASVFGAWWAACLLRPQIQTESSLFPFMGLEATAESGKTTGFFDLMVQLNGNTRGQLAPTRPVLRDSASANKSGIVWVDDMDDLSAYGELLRASTANGTASKMDADHIGVKATRIVAPILVSGERLGLSDQKALADRAYILSVPSPKNRTSTHGNYPQWDDVLNVMHRYPKESGGLSVLSGWMIQDSLAATTPTMECLRGFRRESTGRFGDRMAVLRAGARLLDNLCGEKNPWDGTGQHSQLVDAWVGSQSGYYLEGDNALTTRLVPWALRQFGFPEAALEGERMGRFAGIDTPAFVVNIDSEEGLDGSGGPRVWVSANLLADAWARDHNHRVEARTETPEALRQQLDALKATSRAFAVKGTSRRLRYRCLPAEYSARCIDRARS